MDARTVPARVDASVIVVTYNSAAWIRGCLESLLLQEWSAGHEVVVVDHESRDDTVPIIRSAFPDVRLFQAPNRGFGAGANRGAKEARGRLLAFVNPDTIVEPDWLKNLLLPLREPRTITTSQIVLLDNPRKVNTLGHDVHFVGFGFTRRFGADITDEPTHEVPGFSGAAFALSKEDFETLGGFDESIFLYGEDTELSWRAREAGGRILAVPSSVVRHRYHFRIDAEKLYHIERGRRILLRNHYRWRDRLALGPSLAAAKLATWGTALRFGTAGIGAVLRAARSARNAPRRRSRPTVRWRRFVSRRMPVGAVGGGWVARGLAYLLNAVFRVNTLTWSRPWRIDFPKGGAR